MEPVKILWFNLLKNYGEGINVGGDKVFLPGTSFKDQNKARLKEDVVIYCDFREDSDWGLYAYSAEFDIQAQMFKEKSVSDPEISP